MGSNYCICLVTTDSTEVAKKLAFGLVQNKLAACVNIISNITSIYEWQKKIENSQEILLIIKTKTTLTKDIIKYIKDNHNYSIPEIIFLPIIDGNEDYLDWIGANTLFTTNIPIDKEKKEKQ
ncbi:MAG: divalent-cation tolerance protein CutA [Elusimicrobiales bacterium]|nr:divalent-cation tolerance protein CutA [Elusimicrobiales bacterium]